MERDVVCGMQVAPAKAAGTSEVLGKTYYFCSSGCKAKFDADPSRYVASASSSQLAQHTGTSAEYTCPMHPEIRQQGPGACPKCGMALEPVLAAAPATTEWTCPMHPEIVRSEPGACPICGMALERRTVTLDERNPELEDMTRRFRVSSVLTAPAVILAMGEYLPGHPFDTLIPGSAMPWVQLALATPVVIWGGWPFFTRGWQSLVNRSLNMFTLIALGVGVAYLYSVIATTFPALFPLSFRMENGTVGVYFEAAAVIVALVLLGQVLELRARSQTGAAIRALLGLAPKTLGASETMAARKTCHSITFELAIVCACGLARKFRSTGRCSRAPAPSTSPWSPASRFRSKSDRATR